MNCGVSMYSRMRRSRAPVPASRPVSAKVISQFSSATPLRNHGWWSPSDRVSVKSDMCAR
jgi:hypothetical protein